MGIGYAYDLEQQSYPCGSKIKGACFLKESAWRHHGLYSEMCMELIKFDNSTFGSEAACEEINPSNFFPNAFEFNVTCDNGHWFFIYQDERDNVKVQLNGINCFLR
uniref:Uncharacterized protein n=1 Tax=Acrobeloides nanus TaxID=290746 RepID=A0A914DUC4_9BILA